jgi:hypothetical protein
MKNEQLKSKKLEATKERSSFIVCDFASHLSLFIFHFSLPMRSVIWPSGDLQLNLPVIQAGSVKP